MDVDNGSKHSIHEETNRWIPPNLGDPWSSYPHVGAKRSSAALGLSVTHNLTQALCHADHQILKACEVVCSWSCWLHTLVVVGADRRLTVELWIGVWAFDNPTDLLQRMTPLGEILTLRTFAFGRLVRGGAGVGVRGSERRRGALIFEELSDRFGW